MIFLYQELSRQPYTTIVSNPAIQNFSFIHVMSEIIIFDFFMCFLWCKKIPTKNGGANKKRRYKSPA